MLRLVGKLSAYCGLMAALACAACCWAQEDAGGSAAAPASQPAGQPAAVDTSAAQERTSSNPWSEAPDAELPPAELFESLTRFGEGVFALPGAAEGEADRQAPPANQPVPPDYVIGPGDSLSLSVWSQGWEHVSQTVTVSPEGLIIVPEAGRLTAAGQTLGQLREALLQVYRRSYVDPTLTLVVAEQRVVEVYVTGDAARPGKYALPGMATVLTALYACGGPSPLGSYRSIQLSRAGQPPVTVDLYDYLLRGQREADLLLRPGDALFIPPVAQEVGLAGEVRRPARYELKDALSVAEALSMAGGLKPTAYQPLIYLWRAPEGRRWQMTGLDCSDPASPDLRQRLRGGDLLVIKRMLPIGANTVLLRGAVRRPGRYPVTPETRLSDLLREAEGVSPNAHLGTGALYRRNADLHYEVTTFSLQDVLDGKPEADLALRPYDIVEIFAQEDVEPPPDLQVTGAVRRPGTYRWAANMRVSQLLLLAGGPVPGAYLGRAELLRVSPDQRYQIIPLDLGAALSGDPAADLSLQRGDLVHVRLQEEAEPLRQVHVEGYVREGGSYPRHEGMKVSDLIFAAGGLEPGAGPTIELTHGHFEGRPETVTLQLAQAPGGYQVEPDLLLADDDSVCVSGRGEFSVQADLVHLQGRVERPGTYALKPEAARQGYTVWDLLQEAGGPLTDANPDGIVVYRRRDLTAREAQAEDLGRVLSLLNQETRQPTLQLGADQQAEGMADGVEQGLRQVLSGESSVSIILPPRPVSQEDRVAAIPVEGGNLLATRGREDNLELQAGDTVVVPRRVNTVTVLGAVPRPGTVPYVADQTCGAYVNESGGFREDAASERMVVVRANGRVTPIQLGAAAQPGDVIVIPARHIVRTVRTESQLQQWLRAIVPLVTAALIF